MSIDKIENKSFISDMVKELYHHIFNGELILFLGAGFSKNAGSFDWKKLCDTLLSHPEINLLNNTDRFSEEQIIEYCRSELSKKGLESFYKGIVRKTIIKDHDLFKKSYFPMVEDIIKISPLPIFVTTNFDSFLEETNLFDLDKVYYKPDDFNITNIVNKSIFHIHGYVEDLWNALLTESQYTKMYKRRDFKNFIKYCYNNYNIIFLGYDLKEHDLKKIFFEANNEKSNKNHKRNHYALFPSDKNITDLDIKIYSESYNINIIQYGDVEIFSSVISFIVNEYHSFKTTLEPKLSVGKEGAHAE